MARKDVEKYILETMTKLTSNPRNRLIYEDRFKQMSDDDFRTWVESVISRKTKLAIYLPNDETKANMGECIKFAKGFGYDFYQRLRIPATDMMPEHLSPVPHLLVRMHYRRQSQTFNKKVRVAKDDTKTDALNNQAISTSKASSISAPENRVLAGIGLKFVARELNKVRGGDAGAYKAYKYFLENTGKVSQDMIEPYVTGTGSVKVLSKWLRGKLIDSTL